MSRGWNHPKVYSTHLSGALVRTTQRQGLWNRECPLGLSEWPASLTVWRPSIGKWIHKGGIQGNDVPAQAAKCINHKNMLSELSQIQKEKYCMSPLT